MLLASLIDLGADQDRIRSLLREAGLEHPAIQVTRVRRAGISALHVDVPQSEEPIAGHGPIPEPEEHHELDRHHDQHHQHCSYASIRRRIDALDLSEFVRQHAQSALGRLAEAESKIHGVPIDEVHFHEVGAVDTIADILGVCLAMDDLGGPTVSASPVAVGSGTVRVTHGLLPVPAPATMELLRGVPIWSGDGPEVELTTPTGAALLTEFCQEYGSMPPMVVEAVGHGAGTRELEDRPNVLRAVMGTRSNTHPKALTETDQAGIPAVPDLPSDRLVEIRANIDDMPAELLASLTEALLDAGALDAWITPVVMKKGRPGHVVSLLCRTDDLNHLAHRLLEDSTAFGLRWSPVERARMPRRSGRVDTPWGMVEVMVALREGLPIKAAPEFESCRSIARQAGVALSKVYRKAKALCEDTESLILEDDA